MSLFVHKARKIILGFCFAIALLVPSDQSWSQAAASGLFEIFPADDIYADSARYYLEYFQDILADLLGEPLDTTVTIYLASSEKEFSQFTGSSIPDWGAGVASLENNRIVIKSPKYMETGKSFRELIGHELTHIMLHRASGGRWLPRWIHEGLAMHVSGEWSMGQDILVARAAWTKNLIQLHSLEGMSAFNGAKANLAYTESYLAVSSLLKREDPYLLADLLASYRDTNDFLRSFRMVAGTDYSRWIGDWFERTSMQYHLLLFIFDWKLFWLALPLLIVFLFFLKKRQNVKTKRRWKIEERLNPPDDSYRQYYDGYYDDENQV
jgi:hypothetical protein